MGALGLCSAGIGALLLLVGGTTATSGPGSRASGTAAPASTPAPSTPPVPATTTTTLPAPPVSAGTWHPILDAGFAGNQLDPGTWTNCYPWFTDPARGCTNFGNDELEWYLPSQDQVSGGALHLVADETPTSGTDAGGASTVYPWTSGMVTTWGHFSFTYGFVEIEARVPAGQGLWPALWLLPTTLTSPPEIDIMEGLGTAPFSASFTLHAAGSSKQEQDLPDPDLPTGYHLYAVDWEPGSITWYVDGNAAFSTTTGVPDQPMYFLADLAVYGSTALHSGASTPTTNSFDISRVAV